MRASGCSRPSAAELESLRIFTRKTVSIFAGALRSTTTAKHNIADAAYKFDLTGTDVAIANFGSHTTERKAYLRSGVIETSSKADRLLIRGLTRSGFINHQ